MYHLTLLARELNIATNKTLAKKIIRAHDECGGKLDDFREAISEYGEFRPEVSETAFMNISKGSPVAPWVHSNSTWGRSAAYALRLTVAAPCCSKIAGRQCVWPTGGDIETRGHPAAPRGASRAEGYCRERRQLQAPVPEL